MSLRLLEKTTYLVEHHNQGSEGLERVCAEYNQNIDLRKIDPKLIKALYPEQFHPEGFLAILRDPDGSIAGVMQYHALNFFSPNFYDTLHHLLNPASLVDKTYTNRRFSDFFYADNSNHLILYVALMESFRRGAGTELMEDAKSLPNLSQIFLDSLSEAKGFYEKRGFVNTQFHKKSCPATPSRPIMLWTRN